MDALSTLPQPGPVRAVPPAVAAGDHAAAVPHANLGVENVGVEFSRRSDGIQTVTFIDRRTGVVISQTPPAQVLAVVDALVAAIQRREA
jgi:hypothetical protein